MKKKIIIAIIMLISVLSSVLVACGSNGDDVFISDVTDNGNDSTTNTQMGEDEGGDSSGESTVTTPLYAEKTPADALLGGWTTSNGDIYEFGNFNKLVLFDSTKQGITEGTYETDGQTYVTITLGESKLTYVVKLSTQTNSIGDEVEVLVITKDETSIVMNKQYDIKKLSESLN